MVYTRVGVWIPQCPPKNWEARSWSGDGRRPSGALHSTGFGSLDRACGSSSSSSSSKCVASLALVELACSNCRGPGLEKSWYWLIVLESGSQTGAPPGQLDPQLDRVEFPLFGLDRVGASGLGTLPPSLRVVFSFPWLERRGSVRLLGREPPWSGEE
ncbi:unnamed protein product [Microthlaspi erraticum]|uniref:Uncharacterized protein n=1 Tax=Microthlaspi erraticum TaxID=1685480 RepID=A0A6D2KHA1_9BRAS|nr:unnamed protein product [Microthlaspi erraticum]